MKYSKLFPVLLASFLIMTGCGKQTSSKEDQKSTQPSESQQKTNSKDSANSSSVEQSDLPSSTNSSSQRQNNNAPTDVASFVNALRAFDQAESYSVCTDSEIISENEISQMTMKQHLTYHSEADYRSDSYRSIFTYNGELIMPYSSVKQLMMVTSDEDFAASYKKAMEMIVSGVYDYKVDAEKDELTVYFDSSKSEEGNNYSYSIYDKTNEQWYSIYTHEATETEEAYYYGDYLLDIDSPNENTFTTVLLSHTDEIQYDATAKAFVFADPTAFTPLFAGQEPTALRGYLDNDGNLYKLEAVFGEGEEATTNAIEISNINKVPAFDTPTPAYIGCKQGHDNADSLRISYEVSEDGHRPYCNECRKYLGKKESHSINNAYNFCPVCRQIPDLEPYDDAGLIKDPNAEYDNSKYYYCLEKSATSKKLYDRNSYVPYDSFLFTTGETYNTEVFYFADVQMLLVVAKSDEGIPLADSSKYQVYEETIYLYKNVQAVEDENNYGEYLINNVSFSEFTASATPNKAYTAYVIQEVKVDIEPK